MKAPYRYDKDAKMIFDADDKPVARTDVGEFFNPLVAWATFEENGELIVAALNAKAGE